jgi:tetratricopeptide (TPR) repeat protein
MQATSGDPAAMDMVKQGRKLSDEGKHDDGLALYRKAMQADPKLYDAHLAAGIALDLKGQYAQAREHLQKAIEFASQEQKQQALRTMAMSYAFEGKADEAAKYEKQVFDARMAKQEFEGAAGVANELARIYLESGDVNNAEKWYRTGYETGLRKSDLKPEEKALWEFRWQHAQARIAARRGQATAAKKYVAAARAALDKLTGETREDQEPYYPYLTGYVAFYGGDYKTAIADLQKADQRDPFIQSLLAQAHEKSGNQAKAREHYQKVLESNFHNPTNAFARPLAMKRVGARIGS